MTIKQIIKQIIKTIASLFAFSPNNNPIPQGSGLKISWTHVNQSESFCTILDLNQRTPAGLPTAFCGWAKRSPKDRWCYAVGRFWSLVRAIEGNGLDKNLAFMSRVLHNISHERYVNLQESV